jgi:hypothetical protein
MNLYADDQSPILESTVLDDVLDMHNISPTNDTTIADFITHMETRSVAGSMYNASVDVCGSGINQACDNSDAAGGLSSSWEISARTSALGRALGDVARNGIGRLRHAVTLMARLWILVFETTFRASIVAEVHLSK